MPTPEGLTTTTLHGLYVEPDATGTPLQGTLSFTPNPAFILYPDENVIVAGTETATLDENGEFSIELVSTDNPDSNPSGWVYTVTEKIIGQRQRTYNIVLPYNGGVEVELADITPTEAAPTYLPVVGPQGAPGIVTSVNGHSAAIINLVAADLPDLIPTAAINANSGVVGISAAGRVGVGITGGGLWAKFMVQSAADEVLAAFVQTNAAATNPGFLVNGAAAGWGAFGTSVAGDSNNRFSFTAGGTLTWGPGNAVTDVSLSRTAVGVLTTDGQIISTQVAPTANGHLTRKDYVDTGDAAAVKITGTQSVAGAKNFTTSVQTAQLGVGVAPGTNRVTILSVVDEVGLQVTQSTVTATIPLIAVTAFDTSSIVVAGKVNADSVNRIAIKASGNIEFGTGGGSRDTTISRSAAGELTVTSQIIASAAAPTAVGHLTRKDYVDGNFVSLGGTQTVTGAKTFSAASTYQNASSTAAAVGFKVTGEANPRFQVNIDGTLNWGPGGATATDSTLYREAATTLASNSIFRSYRPNTSDNAFSARVNGDTTSRWFVNANGSMNWGPGGAGSADANLYRSGVGLLATDVSLNVGASLTVGGVDTGRGIKAFVNRTSAVTIPNATDAVLLTLPSMTFVNGRAYKFTVYGYMTLANAETYALFNFRKGTTSSSTIIVGGMRVRGQAAAGGSDLVVMTSFIITNTSGADVTTQAVWTGSVASGTGTWDASSTTLPSYAMIEDVGLASAYPTGGIMS